MKLLPYDRKRDALEILDPRIKAGRLKCIAKPRLVDARVTARISSMRTNTAKPNVSDADVARFLGVSKATLSNWVNGRQPMSNRRMVEAAYKLDVSPFWLLGTTDDCSFDWAALTLPPEQFKQAARIRGQLETLVQSLSVDYRHDLYQGDYRDPRQVIADAICCKLHNDADNNGYVSAFEMLLNAISMNYEKA